VRAPPRPRTRALRRAVPAPAAALAGRQRLCRTTAVRRIGALWARLAGAAHAAALGRAAEPGGRAHLRDVLLQPAAHAPAGAAPGRPPPAAAAPVSAARARRCCGPLSQAPLASRTPARAPSLCACRLSPACPASGMPPEPADSLRPERARRPCPNPALAPQEVAVCFGARLMRGNRVQKVHSSAYRAFDSLTYPPLATLGVDVEWGHRYLLQVRRPPPGRRRPVPEHLQHPHSWIAHVRALSSSPAMQVAPGRALAMPRSAPRVACGPALRAPPAPPSLGCAAPGWAQRRATSRTVGPGIGSEPCAGATQRGARAGGGRVPAALPPGHRRDTRAHRARLRPARRVRRPRRPRRARCARGPPSPDGPCRAPAPPTPPPDPRQVLATPSA